MNNRTRRMLRAALALTLAAALAACALTESPLPAPTSDTHPVETQVAASIFATQTAAAPTATGAPAAAATAAPGITERATSATLARATATNAPEIVVTSTLPSGWIRYEMQTSKFSIELPRTWRRFGMNAAGLEEGSRVVDELNPKYRVVLAAPAVRSMVASGIRFYALDLSAAAEASPFPITMNVFKTDLGSVLTLSTLESSTLTQIEKTADPSMPISHRHLTFGGVEALEFKYLRKFTFPGQDPILFGATQYVLLDGAFMLVVTLVAPSDFAADNAKEFDQIGQTFRFLK